MTELQQYLPSILLSLSAIMLALMSPGPNVLAVMGTSMGVGRKESLALAIGVATGTLVWVSLTVFGFTSVIVQYAKIMIALKVLGGCYLLWLGFKSLRSACSKKKSITSEVRIAGGSMAYFKRGLSVQLSNPKAALAMIAIVSVGLQPGAPSWVGYSLIAATSLLSLIAHCLYAVAFSTTAMLRLYGKFRRSIEAMLGAFFVFLGLRLLSSEN